MTRMAYDQLLTMTPQGLFCPAGNFHIDPTAPVARAVISHGHADHARPGHEAVLATKQTLDMMQARYGTLFARSRQALSYRESIRIGDAAVTLIPAGHVLGSAQILIELANCRAVVSGDYKRTADPTCAAFEPAQCDLFVTEATFGLPVFRHPDPLAEIGKLARSTEVFPERAHLVGAYSLGKAQRIIALLRRIGWDRPIWIHGAIEEMTEVYRRDGFNFGDLRRAASDDRSALCGEIVICPPSALSDRWARRFREPILALASGWMRVRARARQRGVDLPLVISDHADWDELCATIIETKCEEAWITHGAEDALAHWAMTRGLRARPLQISGYEDDDEETAAPLDSSP